MKATGVVVEYNPFHNGHLHHVTEARNRTDADIIIAVMSGNFLQRGEPAFVDKRTRAKMALENHVDIVFELPYAFATAHAPEFARGAITLLDAAHCDAYCFGSEDGDIQAFERALDLIERAGQDYEQTVKTAVKQGVSYPQALNEAYRQTVRLSDSGESVVDLTKPNNILGYQYMEAARTLGSSMKAVTIPRIIAGYHDKAVVGNSIASATGIRKSFLKWQHWMRFRVSSQNRLGPAWWTGRRNSSLSALGLRSTHCFASSSSARGPSDFPGLQTLQRASRTSYTALPQNTANSNRS